VLDPVTRDGPLLLLCLAFALQGCLFAEPPEFNPRQTGVTFDLAVADPLPTKLVQFGTIAAPVAQQFTVKVISEDAGEEVWWAMHVNLNVGNDQFPDAGPNFLEPSTWTDKTREIRFTYQPLDDRPCRQLTLMACHRSSFNLDTSQCQPEAHEDTAMAVWWGTLGDGTISDCPQAAQTP